MTEVFEKRLKYMGNDLEICEMAKEMAYIYGARFKYLRNGISMLQMI